MNQIFLRFVDTNTKSELMIALAHVFCMRDDPSFDGTPYLVLHAQTDGTKGYGWRVIGWSLDLLQEELQAIYHPDKALQLAHVIDMR